MIKKHLYILFLSLSCYAYTQEINWITFEEAIILNKENPKTILIDVYTDWCGYCKKMDKNTYENPIIARTINEDFYAVKLNAEQKNPITYNGKKYKFVENGRRGYHEFAVSLLRGKMSYPNTVFMSENEEVLTRVPGYLIPEKMEPILAYFTKERYLRFDWIEFEQEFSSKL